MKNAIIENAFNAYLADKTAGNRLNLESVIKEENEKAKNAFILEYPFDGTFSAFLSSDKCIRIASATFDEEGNISVTEDIPVKLTAYKYLKLAVNADKLESIEKKNADACNLLKSFFDTFIAKENENGETIVSIKSTKQAMETAFAGFGFTGHVTSSNLKAAALHVARVSKNLKACKRFRLANLLTIFEMINHANTIDSEKREKDIASALEILNKNGYKVSKPAKK